MARRKHLDLLDNDKDFFGKRLSGERYLKGGNCWGGYLAAIPNPNLPAFSLLSLGPTVLIQADGTLWQDSARTSLVNVDGQSIGSADDSSGFANNALQAGAGKPVFKTNIFGSLPGMLFTAASSQYLQTVAFAAALSPPITVLVSEKITDLSLSRIVFDGRAVNTGLFRGSVGLAWVESAGTILSGGTADTNSHVVVAIFNAASSKFYIDGGSAVVSGNAGSNSMVGLTLGANGTPSVFLQGYILDALVLPYLPTLAQLNAAGPLMATRAGTTWTTAV